VPVLVHDRRRWCVINPALTQHDAAGAVAELRRSAAATNVGRVRRVLRWTPLLVFALVVVGGIAAAAEADEALALREGFGATAFTILGAAVVLVGAATLALFVAGRAAPDLDDPAPSTQVVRIPAHVLSWVTDDTPSLAIWRVTAAVTLLEELRQARWDIGDVVRWEGDEPEDDVDGRAVAALLVAEAAAVDDLALVAAETGYVPSENDRKVAA